jgi:hypothetical protein
MSGEAVHSPLADAIGLVTTTNRDPLVGSTWCKV